MDHAYGLNNKTYVINILLAIVLSFKHILNVNRFHHNVLQMVCNVYLLLFALKQIQMVVVLKELMEIVCKQFLL